MDNVVQAALNTLYNAAQAGQTYLYRIEDLITFYLQYGDQTLDWIDWNASGYYAWDAVHAFSYSEPCSGVVSGGASALNTLKNACVLTISGDDNFVGSYRDRARHVMSTGGLTGAVNSAISGVWGARQNLDSHKCSCDASATGGQYASWACAVPSGGGGPDDPPQGQT